MYLTREIEEVVKIEIENYRKPLFIIGARQVGKTTCVKQCLSSYDYIYVNMFDTFGINDVFNDTADLSVNRIVSNLELLVERSITTETIIVIDEIQSNPAAISSLKSFNEDGRYRVIALGSNVGSFLLSKSKYSFPVGQFRKIHMYPFSFTEFLVATNNQFLLDTLKKEVENQESNPIAHEKLLAVFDIYMTVGGMPEVVANYIRSGEKVIDNQIKLDLVDGYLSDFGKFEYAIDNTKALNVIYRSIPQFLNKDNQKFIFSEINYEYKQLNNSFKWLHVNNYVILTPQINSLNRPLISNVKESAFKLFANETSLLLAQARYEPQMVIKEQDKIYYGFAMENYVASVLSKYYPIYTYRKNKTEIDFVFEDNNKVYAIEVKSGNNTRAKSLATLKQNIPETIAIKLSRNGFKYGDINTIPLYAIDYMLKESELNKRLLNKG